MMTAEPMAPLEPEAVPPVVRLSGLHRSFGDNAALTDLDLEVPHQKITVLLGPNGAGKTTAIRMITGALGPDAGSVSVFGLDPDVDGQEVRNRCGVVSAKPSLYDRLSGRDNLAYAAELYGLGRGERAAARIDHASERFGITDALGATGRRLLDRYEDPAGARPKRPPRTRARCSTTNRPRASIPSRPMPCSSSSAR